MSTTQEDPRVEAAVEAALAKQIPHILRLEKFLAPSILIWTALIAIGVLPAAIWAGKKVLQEIQEQAASDAVGKSTQIKGIQSWISGISTNLDKTFQSQVDSASVKRLRFGCAKDGEIAVGFQPCKAMYTPSGLEQAIDDQTIIIVANPERQMVRLDIVIQEVPPAMQKMVLQLVTGAPPVGGNADNARVQRLVLAPEQLPEPGSRDYLVDGRLALYSTLGALRASVNLTPSLMKAQLSGPLQVRFELQQPVKGKPDQYERTSGGERLVVRTITSVYHRIPSVAVAEAPK